MSPEEAFAELPPALLLLGPGGWEAGERLYERHRSSFSTRAEKLDAVLARYVAAQARICPPGRSLRVFLLCLDGASDAALNTLLLVLEDPPEPVRFILTATVLPLRTIVSRCQVLTPAPPEQAQAGPQGAAHTAVATAVRAARDGHLGVLETVMGRWDPEFTLLLRAWAVERAADRWVGFSPDFVTGVSVRQAMTILALLRAYEGARTAPFVALAKAFHL
jgi:hypothetical protein